MQLIDNDIFSNNREIYRLTKEIDTLKVQYAKTIEYAYKNRSSYDMLNFIFSAVSFNDAIKRIAYLKSYREYREHRWKTLTRHSHCYPKKIKRLPRTKPSKQKRLLNKASR